MIASSSGRRDIDACGLGAEATRYGGGGRIDECFFPIAPCSIEVVGKTGAIGYRYKEIMDTGRWDIREMLRWKGGGARFPRRPATHGHGHAQPRPRQRDVGSIVWPGPVIPRHPPSNIRQSIPGLLGIEVVKGSMKLGSVYSLFLFIFR